MTNKKTNDVCIQNMRNRDVYKHQEQTKIPDDLIKKNMSLVEAIASNIASKRNLPTGIEFEDLVSWGLEGLIKAFKKYKDNKGTKFKTYAYYRIRGEILDRIRSEWKYRNPGDYQEQRRVIQDRIAQVTEDAIENSDPSKSLTQQIYNLISNTSMMYLVSLENISDYDSSLSTTENDTHSLYSKLTEFINQLPDEERYIIEMFYINNKKQKEIAKTLNCSNSKICRIHMSALEKLKTSLLKDQHS